MKVCIVKDWEGDMMRQTPGGKGKWEGVTFVNGNSCFADVVVVLNSFPKNIFGFYREGGKWLMSQEPPHESYRWQMKAYPFFDKIFTFWRSEDLADKNIVNTQTSLPWHVNKTYDELMSLNYESLNKRNQASWITSNLNIRPGHELRLTFMDFLQRENFNFDLFGRGFKPIDDKFDGIAPYKYSIAIENFVCNDYWTEKIADCFLSWTMPIYYGCKNITKYFPEQSMILIDPRRPAYSLQKIKEEIANGAWENRIKLISESRQLILNRYQFFPAIVEKINFYKIRKSSRKLSVILKA